MPRSVMAKVLLGGSVLLAAGLLIGAASLAIGYGTDVFVVDGHDIVGMRVSGTGYVMAALAGVAAFGLVGGASALLVGWVAALGTMAGASRWGWFWLLVFLGAPTLGLGALVAYVLVGPEGLAPSVTSGNRGLTP